MVKRKYRYENRIILNGFQTGNKVDRIPVRAAAETVKAPVSLHAGGLIVKEGAAAHPVPAHPDTITLGGLPGGDRLLDSFKYIR